MKKISWGQIALHTIFIIVSLIYILPFILVVSVSFSSENAIYEFGYTLFPKEVSLEAYKQILQNPTQLFNSYKTTIIFTTAATLLSVLVNTLAAYPLSRPNYKFKGILTFYIFFTMLFNGGLVPSYIINTQYLRLDNTMWIYIWPGLVNAWYIIIIRTFFKGLPESLVESAKLDGASDLKIYFKIIMPLSTPVIATIAFMTLIYKWNDWYTALIYIRKPGLYSLQYMLQKILQEVEFVKKIAQQTGMLGNYEVPAEGMRFAMAVLTAGPVLIIFPFFQKYLASGLTIGAIKG